MLKPVVNEFAGRILRIGHYTSVVIGKNEPGMEATDADSILVARVIAGDAEAYGLLYERYAPLIRAVCFDTSLDGQASQDLCQETFLRAYRKLGSLQDRAKFPAWLIAISRFVCREWKRSKVRDRHRYVGLNPVDQLTDAGFEPGDAEELQKLHVAIARLRPEERLALHLFYLKEQPADQARAVMNLSRAGFYHLLERARHRLAIELGVNQEQQP